MTTGGRHAPAGASRHTYDRSAILPPDPLRTQRRRMFRSLALRSGARADCPKNEETRNEFRREEAPQEDAEAQASQDAEEDTLATEAQRIGSVVVIERSPWF